MAKRRTYRRNPSKPAKSEPIVTRTATPWTFWVKVVAGIAVAIVIVLLFYFGVIGVGISFVQSELEHTIFSLLNGLILGIFVNTLGLSSGLKKGWLKYLSLIILVTFVILGLGMLSIKVYVNLPFLIEKLYVSNTGQGIRFFTSNAIFFTSIYLSTFLTESEKTE